jgi:DNA-binding response OmpR family regulator
MAADPMTGKRVLIVDDEQRDAELIAALATAAGLRSELVRTAGAARSALRRDLPTAVVLDLRLPDERGERLLEDMKAQAATSAIPVIVVTVEDDDGRSRAMGADDHLTKPIDAERLGAWLRRLDGNPPLSGSRPPPSA